MKTDISTAKYDVIAFETITVRASLQRCGQREQIRPDQLLEPYSTSTKALWKTFT